MAKTLTEQLLQDILRKITAIEDKLEGIDTKQEEIMEKIDNISTPGVDYDVREYP